MAGISGQRAKLEVMKKLSIESLLFNVKFFLFLGVCGGGWGWAGGGGMGGSELC